MHCQAVLLGTSLLLLAYFAQQSQAQEPNSECRESNSCDVSQDNNCKYKPRVIIIGAGASGLAAAYRLMLNNVKADVTILEAKDRIGGRLNCKKFTHPNGDTMCLDEGGHWIHGQEGNVVYEMVKDLDLVEVTKDYQNLSFFLPNGTGISFPDNFYELADITFDVPDNITVPYRHMGEFVEAQLDKYARVNNIDPTILKMLKYTYTLNALDFFGAQYIKDLSFKLFGLYEDASGPQFIQWKSGTMTSVLRLLTGGIEGTDGFGLNVKNRVLFSQRVVQVNYWRGESAVVTTENGLILFADYVIVTTSLGVLKKNHSSMFVPPLPRSKIDAIEALGMDTVNKIYLVFKRKWWNSDVVGFVPLHAKQYPNETSDWGNGIVSYVGETAHPTVLVVWVVGPAALAMEEETDEDAGRIALRVLQQHVGRTYKISPVVTSFRSKWGSDQDVWGSYSYNSVEAEKLVNPRRDLAASLPLGADKKTVLFGGEATSEHQFGTVHGAVNSGFSRADEVIASISIEKCSSFGKHQLF